MVAQCSFAQPAAAERNVPKIWDDAALEGWATPIAALGVRPGHFTSAEYYAVPGDNLKTYPVYRPDREPPGYWEWLQKQKPQRLVDASKLRNRQDWIKAGESAFRFMDEPPVRTSDPATIQAFRDPQKYDGVWTHADGTLLFARWVVTGKGVQVSTTACAACHGRPLPDGTVLWGAPGVTPDRLPGIRDFLPVRIRLLRTPMVTFPGDSDPVSIWRQFTVPWAPDERVEQLRNRPDAARVALSNTASTFPRTHGSPFYATKIPDLNPLRFSRYMDATGTHRLRGPEDIARYAAFIMGADPMEFGAYRILTPAQRKISFRYADELLYAIGVYVMSLEPAGNPSPPPGDLVAHGREIFARETCINCHVPPSYSSGRLTLAQGFMPASGHPNEGDILSVSVGTDPGLALRTRKGTGFYKIPSLRGLWYRPALLHDGSVATLDEMFDPERLKPDHVPGGWKGPGVTKRSIPGHPFGLGLNSEDKKALLAFLRTL
jgi:mono/diheme cytochrome c family protein